MTEPPPAVSAAAADGAGRAAGAGPRRIPPRAGADATTTLRWGLVHYAPLFLLCVLLVALVVPALQLRGPSLYEARAIVVAEQLGMDLNALPRYAEAVFDNGAVAARVAGELGDAGDAEDIVPERVTVLAEQDSIVMQVRGSDPTATMAAELANVAAAEFVAELNKGGIGVGTFAIQSEAVPPLEPEQQLRGVPMSLVVGALGGVALGLAAVAGLLVVRRPVLDAATAEAATGVPVLGTVTLPGGRAQGRAHDRLAAHDAAGVVPLCRRLLATGSTLVLLVSDSRVARDRRRLATAMADALQTVAPVRLVSSGSAASEPAADRPELAEEVRPTGPGGEEAAATVVTLVDGADPIDWIDAPARSSTVLVVRVGIGQSALVEAASAHVGQGAGGIVLLRRGRARSGR